MADKSIAHVILTRFNMPTAGREARVRRDPMWLRRRFELFEMFCLPSVLAQDRRDFEWIIYFDSETPPPYRERIDELAEMAGLRPILRPDVVPLEHILEHVKESCLENTTHVITTALDNDDALARDFVSRLRRGADQHPRAALNFPRGVVFANGKTYVRTDESNAFISMIEPITELGTVWAAWHTDLGKSAPLVQMDDRLAWLQVVHERNVSNRVRGRRVPAAAALEAFAVNLPAPQSENGAAIRIENAVLIPIRQLRDMVIRLVKPAVHRVLRP